MQSNQFWLTIMVNVFFSAILSSLVVFLISITYLVMLINDYVCLNSESRMGTEGAGFVSESRMGADYADCAEKSWGVWFF